MKKYLPFILMFLMLLLILGFSSQSGTTSNGITNKFSAQLETFLNARGKNGYNAEEINLILRKLAHFTEYMVFALLMVSGLNNVLKKIIPAMLITTAMGLGLAYLDEMFQRLSINRTSSLFDVMIDSLGVIVAVGLVGVFHALNSRYIRVRKKDISQ